MIDKDAKRFILLVEDNPSDAMLTTRAFERQGIKNEIRLARDGAEALEMLLPEDPGAHHELPILILLDLKLPRVSGLDVLRAIRADMRTRFIPVVVMTTSSEQADLVDSYDLGANSYIRKPVNHTEFSDAVRQLGFYWLLLNQSPSN